MTISIKAIDHLVLTVSDINKACEFYNRILGMKIVTFGNGRKALSFGKQKINLHEQGKEAHPKAMNATPGTADICLLSETSMDQIAEHLNKNDVEINEGPVQRTGANGQITSIYFRDPDGNLLEIANE